MERDNKKFNLLKYMEILEIPIYTQDDRRVIFFSPFSEGEPTLYIDEKGRTWSEFSKNVSRVNHGNILDFARKYYDISDDEEIKRRIDADLTSEKSISITASNFSYENIIDLSDSFFQDNHIVDEKLIKSNCKKITYTLGDTHKTAYAQINRLGGYVIIDNSFQCTFLGPPGPILIHRKNQEEFESVSNSPMGQCIVFYNYLDYLSYLSIGKIKNKNMVISDYVILNSIDINKDLFMPFCDCKRIWTWLPNCYAGMKATTAIMREFGDKVVNLSKRFPQYLSPHSYLCNPKNST